MVFPHYSITFSLLFLSFYCLITSTTPQHQTVFVEIRNDLPKKTDVQLELDCDHGSSFDLKLGDDYNRTITTVDQDLECTAAWSPLFTTWDVYKAKRYKGFQTVYWSVRNDGFYRSFDGSQWKFVEQWYTE